MMQDFFLSASSHIGKKPSYSCDQGKLGQFLKELRYFTWYFCTSFSNIQIMATQSYILLSTRQ